MQNHPKLAERAENRQERREDRKEVGQDTKEIRGDRKELHQDRQELRGEIHDDGCGFESVALLPAAARGQGLENMQRRAAQLGGQVTIASTPGHGTHIKLMLPLKRR